MTEIQNHKQAGTAGPRWYVYMVRCSDRTLYTGTSTDVERRLFEHNHGLKAAAYTRSRRPVVLVYQENCTDRSSALKREHHIRQLSAAGKEMLINTSGIK